MTKKFILTAEELKNYNDLKLKISRSTTRTEVSLYSNQAKKILDTGRNRYISKLEGKNNKMTTIL